MERTLRYDHYKVLGVPRDATTGEIKRAYRERVKRWHPDRNDSAKASEVFHALHEAYLTLRDQGLRSAYDEQLRHYRSTFDQPKPTGAGMWKAPTARPIAPPTRSERLAFRALHLTGLVFGAGVVGGVLLGIVALDWPAHMAFFTLPGLAILPDSLRGLVSGTRKAPIRRPSSGN